MAAHWPWPWLGEPGRGKCSLGNILVPYGKIGEIECVDARLEAGHATLALRERAIFATCCEFEMLGWCGAAGGGGRPVSGGTPQAACSCSDTLAVRAGLRLGCYCLRPAPAAAATSAHDRRKL